MSSPDMAAWRALTDLKTRQLHMKQPQFSCSSETETETAPCILVTPPSSQTGNNTVSYRVTCNNNLSPLQYRDVHL